MLVIGIGIGYWYWLLVFVSPPGGGPILNFAYPCGLFININLNLIFQSIFNGAPGGPGIKKDWGAKFFENSIGARNFLKIQFCMNF